MILNVVLVLGGLAYSGYLAFKEKKVHQRRRLPEQTATAPSSAEPDLQPDPSVLVTGSVISNDQVDQLITVSGIAFGLAVSGALISSVFTLGSIPLILYTALPIFKTAFRGILEEGRVTASVVDAIALSSCLLTGYYVLGAVAPLTYFFGQKMVQKTERRPQNRSIAILRHDPKTVWLSKNKTEIEIPYHSLKAGDVIVLRAGETVSVDGTVIQGMGSLDEHILTNESQPSEKSTGDFVLASTRLVTGTLFVRVDRTGEETIAAQMEHIMANAHAPSVELQSMRVADQIALPTIVLGGVALYTMGPVGATAVVNCNSSEIMRITAPLGILNYLKRTSEQGVLVKDGHSLELLHNVDTVVFDEAGSLTLSEPEIRFIHAWDDHAKDDILRLAASAGHRQTRPTTRAIVRAAKKRRLAIPPGADASYESGHGIKMRIAGRTIAMGSARFMNEQKILLSQEACQLRDFCHEQGHSLIFVAKKNKVVGAIELHASIRPEAKSVIQGLQQRGKKIVILSGGHDIPVRNLAQRLRADRHVANVLPENKAGIVADLKNQGRVVCFIGDGIFDAIAMKEAHISLSLRGAATAAIDTADIILMHQDLRSLCSLFDVAHDLHKNTRRSMAATIIPSAIGMGGVFLLGFGVYTSYVVYSISSGLGTLSALWPSLFRQPPTIPLKESLQHLPSQTGSRAVPEPGPLGSHAVPEPGPRQNAQPFQMADRV
ncbi:MAG: HAD-IC family P-type ATPase [Magnetococcales bacterium]|nr:HAD-IC family P-type ATPase [Magnetococcales bacterium]